MFLKTALATIAMGILCFIQNFEEEKNMSKVWIEKGGIVVIEAEHFQPDIQNENVSFKLKTEPEGFSGSGFLKWKGTGHWKDKVPYDSLPSDRSLTFFFKISTPGIYYTKVRNYHEKEDGDNDIYISLNKGNWNKIYDHQERQFTWDENGKWDDAYPQNLEKGIYRLEIAGRSEGFGVDKIALFLKKYYPEPLDNHLAQPWFSKQVSETTFVQRNFE